MSLVRGRVVLLRFPQGYQPRGETERQVSISEEEMALRSEYTMDLELLLSGKAVEYEIAATDEPEYGVDAW